MTIACSTTWPKHMPEHLAGQPTEFVDQIWNCLQYDEYFGEWPDNQFNYDAWSSHMDAYFLKNKTTFPFLNKVIACGGYEEEELKMKKHTLREDPKDRWRAGLDIHFVINNRTKQRFQFAPVVKCVSVQKIEILWNTQFDDDTVRTLIDGKPVKLDTLQILAKNDGFDSVEDFFAWFNKDFTGKIIHWTNLKY